MSSILGWLKSWNTGVWGGKRHKWNCAFKRKNIILIDKSDGRRIHDSLMKYCPFCGTKLR